MATEQNIIGLLGECRKNFPYYSMDGRGMHEKTGMARSRLPVAHRKRKQRKTLNGAKLVKGFYGAPNRIRTCGLLIRSQTLYPAELWVRFLIFHSFLLGTKSIILHGAKNVNTFLKIIFHFLPSAGNGGIWGKIPATFGEKRVAENEKEKPCFFLVKKRKKRRKSKTARRAAGCAGGRKHPTLRRAHLWITIIIHNSAPKMAICLWTTVDNLVEKSIFL